METEMDRKLFEQIFSDAHVVDLDLSEWDKSTDLYVLADHVESAEGGGGPPLFALHFLRARSFKLEHDAASVEGLAPHEHVQWSIDDFRLEETPAEISVSLWGMESSPRIEIICEDIQINPFPARVFDELFPGWSEPYRGLARPGPGAMMDLFGSARGKRVLRRHISG